MTEKPGIHNQDEGAPVASANTRQPPAGVALAACLDALAAIWPAGDRQIGDGSGTTVARRRGARGTDWLRPGQPAASGCRRGR